MNIAFDAIPLLGRMTGIGYCEAGQVSAMTRLHPEHAFTLNYFAMRHLKERAADIAPYLGANVTAKHALCSPYGYRVLSTFIPVPYSWFFGGKHDLTHFFNYIIPPHVGGKTVVTVHDMVYRAYPETVRGRTRHMLDLGLVTSMRRADRIVTDSAFSRAEIIKYYPEFAEKLRVVPCGVDLQKYRPADTAEQQRVREKYALPERYFLYLGTLEPRKNLERLIDGYAAFACAYADPPALVLAGAKGWLYDGIFAKVQALGLQERVLFTQYIDGADMRGLMSGALAFTFPSLYEGFGMPPLEAMACGTPVLVSNAASLPEVTGESAVIVKAEDTASITAGLHRLCTDAALRKRLSEEGLARAQQFTWEKSAEKLYQVYEEIIGK